MSYKRIIALLVGIIFCFLILVSFSQINKCPHARLQRATFSYPAMFDKSKQFPVQYIKKNEVFSHEELSSND